MYKGINDFCERESVALERCRAYFGRLGDPELKHGQCRRELEFQGTCRLLASDSISTQCTAEITALTVAVAKKEESGVVQALTDRLYRCGLTPVPGLDDGRPQKLPGIVEEGIIQVIQAQQQREEFVRVVRKQLEEQQQRKHAAAPATPKKTE